MEILQPFSDAKTIATLAKVITQKALTLSEPLRIMEVCGGHTHTLMRYALLDLLPPQIEFIHGPGCPVCIMPRSRIDAAGIIAQQKDVILVTLGDMIRVPGTLGSLADIRSAGANVKAVYSPLEALKIAQENPHSKVVFFAIGFETTTPMTAALLKRTQEYKIQNLLFFINHITVVEPLNAILDAPNHRINALLAPSHVSVITGEKIYYPLVEKFQIPIVIAGFEPVDMLESILRVVEQKQKNIAKVENQYHRCVSVCGNIKAQQLIHQYFVKDDFEWRGLGIIADSSWTLREEFSHYDAQRYFAPILQNIITKEHKSCICGEILRGMKKPFECKLFGNVCVPSNPIGSCMVSSEGACSAYYRYALKRA
ncbi:hydrogenase formation protein HypD [Helicobacter monodelphidis]|nr:hydrogenase formation protein HypD [Helicobacter sp. 15-1451]